MCKYGTIEDVYLCTSLKQKDDWIIKNKLFVLELAVCFHANNYDYYCKGAAQVRNRSNRFDKRIDDDHMDTLMQVFSK